MMSFSVRQMANVEAILYIEARKEIYSKNCNRHGKLTGRIIQGRSKLQIVRFSDIILWCFFESFYENPVIYWAILWDSSNSGNFLTRFFHFWLYHRYFDIIWNYIRIIVNVVNFMILLSFIMHHCIFCWVISLCLVRGLTFEWLGRKAGSLWLVLICWGCQK